MRTVRKKILTLLNLFWILGVPLAAQAGDLEDGISEATEEAVAADESISNKDVNISFIVTDALAKSKNQKKGGKQQGAGQSSELTNLNDGESESNENSIVVGAGSRVDKVTNIVIQK